MEADLNRKIISILININSNQSINMLADLKISQNSMVQVIAEGFINKHGMCYAW